MAQSAAEAESVPSIMLGEFVDDYGVAYTVAPAEWVQGDGTRYHIVEWDVPRQFVVARNDPDNPGAGGLWTRIDWVLFEGASEYEWGFCYAIYEADTPEAAKAGPDTQRETPRSGCNGFPFSRMRRVGLDRPSEEVRP